MIVTEVTTCPYIASRHPNESTSPHIIFEGTKKQCEAYILDIYNLKMDAPYAGTVAEALRFCRKRESIDGLSRSSFKGHHLRFDYDSRIYEVTTKKNLR